MKIPNPLRPRPQHSTIAAYTALFIALGAAAWWLGTLLTTLLG